MRLTSPWLPVLASTLALLACGGGDPGAPGSAGLNALVTVDAIAPGEQCPLGGTLVSAGLDADGDGTLADGEVSSIQHLCHGTPGAPGEPGTAGEDGTDGSNGLNALVRMVGEPAGANCAAGGKAIHIGVDGDGNGTLDPAEVTSTGYVCNGGDGTDGTNGIDGTDGTDGTPGLNTLLEMVQIGPGTLCEHGGIFVSSGPDLDGNGILDPAEVKYSSPQCHGAPGESFTWVPATSPTVNALPNTGLVVEPQVPMTTIVLAPNAWFEIGDTVRVTGKGRWRIVHNETQRINVAFLGTPRVWTAPESEGGGLYGDIGAAVELQYVGDGTFVVLNRIGQLSAL